jgi:hypothetical protein
MILVGAPDMRALRTGRLDEVEGAGRDQPEHGGDLGELHLPAGFSLNVRRTRDSSTHTVRVSTARLPVPGRIEPFERGRAGPKCVLDYDAGERTAENRKVELGGMRTTVESDG